jgi:hypothetical protein
MVFESNTMQSTQNSGLNTAISGKNQVRKRKPSRLTAKVDNEMLGSHERPSARTLLTQEDEQWLRNALQSRLPIF